MARLLAWAILLPAAFSVSYALLFSYDLAMVRGFLFPWMAVSTAALCWCIGRYLWPAWLQWLVLVWALLLLDLLTISACLTGPVDSRFGYMLMLVTAQIAFLVVWTILGRHGWQLRLPIAVVAAAIVIGFSGSFNDSWRTSQAWNVMRFVAAVELTIICLGLRWLGFSIQRPAEETATEPNDRDRSAYQFGTRHMLIWATAVAPLLVVARGLDFTSFKGFRLLFTPETLVLAVSPGVMLATACVLAIWAVLGVDNLVARLSALLLVPPVLAACTQLGLYVYYVYFTLGGTWEWFLVRTVYGHVLNGFVRTYPVLALFAALLLFLRASGYQLMRTRPSDAA